MRGHLVQLGATASGTEFADSLECVVMFIPGDEFLRAAFGGGPGAE